GADTAVGLAVVGTEQGRRGARLAELRRAHHGRRRNALVVDAARAGRAAGIGDEGVAAFLAGGASREADEPADEPLAASGGVGAFERRLTDRAGRAEPGRLAHPLTDGRWPGHTEALGAGAARGRVGGIAARVAGVGGHAKPAALGSELRNARPAGATVGIG